jgi:hypothetical protein
MHMRRGQVGMRYFNKRTNKYWNPIINLDKLWTLVGEEVCSICELHKHGDVRENSSSADQPLCGSRQLIPRHWLPQSTSAGSALHFLVA